MPYICNSDFDKLLFYLKDAALLYGGQPSTKMQNRARLIKLLTNKLKKLKPLSSQRDALNINNLLTISKNDKK